MATRKVDRSVTTCIFSWPVLLGRGTYHDHVSICLVARRGEDSPPASVVMTGCLLGIPAGGSSSSVLDSRCCYFADSLAPRSEPPLAVVVGRFPTS